MLLTSVWGHYGSNSWLPEDVAPSNIATFEQHICRIREIPDTVVVPKGDKFETWMRLKTLFAHGTPKPVSVHCLAAMLLDAGSNSSDIYADPFADKVQRV